MSKKPDGTNGPKVHKAPVYKAKSLRGARRHAKAVETKAYERLTGAIAPRGTVRAKRRFNGDYSPVNKEASLQQAPDGRYAKSLVTKKKTKAVQEAE